MATPGAIAARAGRVSPLAGAIRRASPASRSGGLLDALHGSRRRMTQYGHVFDVPDPHAEDFLRFKGHRELANDMQRFLDAQGLRELRPLDGGFENVVLDGGDRVVKVGMGGLHDFPRDVPGVLAFDAQQRFGPFRVEVQKKVDTSGLRAPDAVALENDLLRRGWKWGDAATDNMGKMLDSGSHVVIDGSLKRVGMPGVLDGLRTR